jgi:predicted amidohydrolase
LARSTSVIKVAVAQIETHLGDLDGNLDRHLTFIEKARNDGIDLLLFPEMSLPGHSGGGETLRLAIRRDDPRLTKLAKAAGPMATVVGLIEEGPAAQFYNSTYTFHNGDLAHIYRKINLATYGGYDDGKHFASGRYVETFFVTPEWRVCILICNDCWNPALVYLAALHGATLLLVPASSGREAVGSDFDNPASWTVALDFYSLVYGLPIVFANRVGTEPGLTFWGGSRVVDAFGHAVAKGGEGEEIVAAELDYTSVRKARYRLPSVRDSNLGLISREIRRLEQIVGVPESVRSS